MRIARSVGLIALVLSVGCEGTLGGRDDTGRSDARVDPGTDGGGPIDAPAVDAPAIDAPPADAPSDDPFAEARRICLDEINRLRATRGLPPYAPWTDGQMCVDQQATADEASGTPHGAWGSGAFASCNGNAQNECLGHGTAGITTCLQQMWAEREQAGCSGCDACAGAYDPSCPDCDFFGTTTGDVCGHYVNMSALYFAEVACGFSTGGGWAAQNFR